MCEPAYSPAQLPHLGYIIPRMRGRTAVRPYQNAVRVGQFLVIRLALGTAPGHIQVNVDAARERPADLVMIAADHSRSAFDLMSPLASEAGSAV